jgi:hypothetical protein
LALEAFHSRHPQTRSQAAPLILVTVKYIVMAAQIEQNVVVLDALTTAPPTDIRPLAA